MYFDDGAFAIWTFLFELVVLKLAVFFQSLVEAVNPNPSTSTESKVWEWVMVDSTYVPNLVADLAMVSKRKLTHAVVVTHIEWVECWR